LVSALAAFSLWRPAFAFFALSHCCRNLQLSPISALLKFAKREERVHAAVMNLDFAELKQTLPGDAEAARRRSSKVTANGDACAIGDRTEQIQQRMNDKNGNNGNGRLDALKKREAEIRAKIAEEKVRRQKREEKEQERLEHIVGRATLAHAGSDPKFAELIKPALQTVTADGEKNLLRARGLL
jgi:hypothetical protein